MEHAGTILKPGTEQVRMQTAQKNRKLFADFEELGYSLALTGTLDQSILDKFKKIYVFPKRSIPMIRFFSRFGVFDRLRVKQMKKNRAYKNCFATPLLN